MNRDIVEAKVIEGLTMGKQGDIYRYVVEDVEKILIEKALTLARGNQIGATKILGINRNTIRMKIRKFGIKITKFKI
mgnify:CR=1 FL=1